MKCRSLARRSFVCSNENRKLRQLSPLAEVAKIYQVHPVPFFAFLTAAYSDQILCSAASDPDRRGLQKIH